MAKIISIQKDVSEIKIEIRRIRQELTKYATKDDLKNFITKKDLKKELSDYATKKDLQRSVNQLIEYINLSSELTKKELREEIRALRDELKRDISQLKRDIIQFKDDILYELIKIRENMDVMVGYRDLIENHEVRIHKLEKTNPHN